LDIYPAHNEILAGDTLTTISLNREWRKIIASAIEEHLFHRAKDELTLDNQDLLMELYQDLYNFETYTMRIFTPQVIDIGVSKTTTSLVPVAVTDTGFNHTFTYPNAIIRCHNIVLSNSGAGGQTKVQIDINGESPEAYAIASNEGTNGRPFTTIARFEDLPLGVSKALRLMMFVTSGTGTMNENSFLVWEIEEWE